jgi:broad specificity phosphatase PhoE
VAAAIGLTPREDARLVETDAGDWTDHSFAEIQARSPELFARFAAGDPTFAFPGGESFAAQADRVVAALRDVEGGPLPALVVCHGGVIRIALRSRSAEPSAHFGGPVPNGALVALEAAPQPSS